MTEPQTSRFRDRPVSFVRRSGRMTEAQSSGWERLAPRYLLSLPRAEAATSVAPGTVLRPDEVFGRSAPLTVEIGSGQGQAITTAADANPERNFLAIEVFRAGLARTMLDADRAGVENLRLVEANAPEVLDHVLPEASVDELWVFFPDPWHKKRHVKRRLVTAGFVETVARVMADDGIVRFATDWEEYAKQMREVFDESGLFERAFEGEWADRFPGRVLTAFEKKGQRAGRVIRDLSYTRVPRG